MMCPSIRRARWIEGHLFVRAARGLSGEGIDMSIETRCRRRSSSRLSCASSAIIEQLERRALLSGGPAGPQLVKDINTGTLGSDPSRGVDVNGTFFFTAYDTKQALGLYKSDGAAAGTVLVAQAAAGGGVQPG